MRTKLGNNQTLDSNNADTARVGYMGFPNVGTETVSIGASVESQSLTENDLDKIPSLLVELGGALSELLSAYETGEREKTRVS